MNHPPARKRRSAGLLLLIAAMLLFRSAPIAYANPSPVAAVQLPEPLQVGDAAGADTAALDFTVYFRNLTPNAAVTLRVEAYLMLSDQSAQPRIGVFGAETRTDAHGSASCSGLRALLAMCPPGRVLLLPQWRANSAETTENSADFCDLSPILLRIASPTVAVECPQTAAVGATVTLTATLENTSLPNIATAEFQNDDNFWIFGTEKVIRSPHLHMPAYFPELEILDGASCVQRGAADALHMRTYRENLTFLAAGTVRLRVRFRRWTPCTLCAQPFASAPMADDPAQIVTIQVTDASDPDVSDPDVSDPAAPDLRPNRTVLPENAENCADNAPPTGEAAGQTGWPCLLAAALLAAAVGVAVVRAMHKTSNAK